MISRKISISAPLVVLAFLSSVFFACDNHVTRTEKELDKSERKNEEKNLALVDADEQIRGYKRMLENIWSTTSGIWVFYTNGVESKEAALTICEDIAYQLPTRALLEEFKNEILDKKSEKINAKYPESYVTVEDEEFKNDFPGTKGTLVCFKEHLK